MNRILVVLFLLFSITATAQYDYLSAKKVLVTQSFRPAGDTVMSPLWIGEIRQNVSGGVGKLYICISLTSAKKWQEISGTGGSTYTVAAGTFLKKDSSGNVVTLSLDTTDVNLKAFITNYSGGGGGGIVSVFGRTDPAILAVEADYSAFYPSLSGSYVNPAWVASIAWPKVTGTPTTRLGYGITDAEGTITAGTSLQYWRGDKTFQTLNTAAVPELANLYFTDARARAAFSAGNAIDPAQLATGVVAVDPEGLPADSTSFFKILDSVFQVRHYYDGTKDTAFAFIDVSGGGGASNLDGLTDVAVTSPVVKNVIRYNGSSWVNTQLDYGDLTNTPSTNPGVYISPAQNLNPGFIVFASAIVRPSNTYVLNDTITWEILDHGSKHNSSFITSVEGQPSTGRLRINYPFVKNVLNGTVTTDETFAGNGIICGPTVGQSNMEITAARVTPNAGVRLTGDGSSNWVKTGATTLLNNETAYATGTSFTVSAGSGGYGTDHNSVVVQYVGTNNYRVRRVFSGLGSYNARFVLVNNATNVDVTTVTSSDIVLISGGMGVVPNVIHLGTWQAANSAILPSSTNFWVFAVFEAWMVAASISTTSIQVRWQTDYPSATNYKIYRATTSNFSDEVLIHTGTSGSYVDTGLTPSTLYYYKYVAVIGGVDNNITSFRANTY